MATWSKRRAETGGAGGGGSVCTPRSRARRRMSAFTQHASSPPKVGEFDQHLPDILPLEQANERLGCMLDAIHDRLLPLDFAGGNPGPHVGIELRLPLKMVRDDEALERQPLAHREAQIAWTGRWRGLVIV